MKKQTTKHYIKALRCSSLLKFDLLTTKEKDVLEEEPFYLPNYIIGRTTTISFAYLCAKCDFVDFSRISIFLSLILSQPQTDQIIETN